MIVCVHVAVPNPSVASNVRTIVPTLQEFNAYEGVSSRIEAPQASIATALPYAERSNPE